MRKNGLIDTALDKILFQPKLPITVMQPFIRRVGVNVPTLSYQVSTLCYSQIHSQITHLLSYL